MLIKKVIQFERWLEAIEATVPPATALHMRLQASSLAPSSGENPILNSGRDKGGWWVFCLSHFWKHLPKA